MKKEIIKPFDLVKAKAGAKLRTRGGLPVEIFKWDARGEYPIKGIVIDKKEDKSTSWVRNGLWCKDSCGNFDLVIVEVEESEPKFWSDDVEKILNGFYINSDADIRGVHTLHNITNNYNIFATEKQAKSALAMSRISQIMANDIANFGGVITDEEWNNDEWKFVIYRNGSCICKTAIIHDYYFLTFHTEKQRDLFFEKYPQLVKDYLCLD